MPQTEYGLGWALTILFVCLGLLLICIPRPRFPNLEAADPKVREAQRRQKAGEKKKKQKMKAKAKKEKRKRAGK